MNSNKEYYLYMVCSKKESLFSWFVPFKILDLIDNQIYMKFLTPDIVHLGKIQIILSVKQPQTLLTNENQA
jgi:hypothetical protein